MPSLALTLATLLVGSGLAGSAGPYPPEGMVRQEPLVLQVAEDGGVRPVLGPILQSRGIQSSLERGLPVRIRIVTELWRDRIVDAQEGRHEWRATVHLDPLDGTLLVETQEATSVMVTGIPQATAFLREQLQVPLRPDRPGRYYYLARLEVETLSLSDLDELRRWLQGDLAPSVEGEGGGGITGALGRGLQRFFIRILGLPAERHRAASSRFDFPG